MSLHKPLFAALLLAASAAVRATACEWDGTMFMPHGCDKDFTASQRNDLMAGKKVLNLSTPRDRQSARYGSQVPVKDANLDPTKIDPNAGAATDVQTIMPGSSGAGLSGLLRGAGNVSGTLTGTVIENDENKRRGGGDLPREQALKLLQEAQNEIAQTYAQPLGGKFRVIGENVVGDMRGWIEASDRENFSSKRLNAQLAMLKAQLAVDLAENRTDLPPAQKEAQIQAARAQFNAAHELIHALPAPGPGGEGGGNGGGSGWGGNPMDRFHKMYKQAFDEYKDPPPPPGQNVPPPAPPKPGAGLPPVSHINDMIRTDPGNANNWTLSAQHKLSGGDTAGGLDALNRSISLNPTADALGLRGGVYLNGGDYKAAYKDALEALKLNPGDKNLMVLLKSVEGRVPADARAQIQASVGSSGGPSAFNRGPSGSAPARGGSSSNAAGFATFLGGATSREIPGMTTPQAMSSSAKLEEARRALALGDLGAALALAQRALELNPSNAAAHAFMASIYARTGDYRRAVASASAGLALAPRDSALLNTKAFSENRLKSYKDALATSNGAIESDPRGPWGYANRAYAYGGLGDKDSMLHDINRAAQIDARFQPAAEAAKDLQLPSNADVLFLFPGEEPAASAAPAPAPKRRFGLVVGAGLAGGLLLALGLLSTVLAPVKDSVVSAFTKATRRGPSLQTLEPATAEPVSVAGEVGGLIRGQYEIVRQIGAGGMGMVYEGNDKSLGRKVAIKKMRDELRVNARERERFVIEAKTVAALRHPHVVDIYAIAEDRDDVYLVFEYVDGKTIHDVVQAQGRLRPADASRVTKAIADALTYAHSRGVIHRDVKPSNVMVSPQGAIKVMDFGIARMAKDALTRYSMTNTVVGTPPYMAPEQEQGVVRKESDVYALAVMSYEMLTGKLPFIGMGAGMLMNKINMSFVAPSRAIAGLPESLDEVFTKAFQADPDNRFRTPQEFAAALDAALGGARKTA